MRASVVVCLTMFTVTAISAPTALELSSPAFSNNSAIPQKHAFSGEGSNVSPPLTWSGVPNGTKELALLCEDPDAPGGWVHWVMYHIPPTLTGLAEGVPAVQVLNHLSGAMQGKNSFGTIGYGGPFPPLKNGKHHYFFKLFALDEPLRLQSGANKGELEGAMRGHIIGQSQWIGTYER